jgi:hypothetical protein
MTLRMTRLGVLRTGFARIAPITLAHNVSSDEVVDATLAAMERAGGRIVERATRREWDGYSGYAADPDGYRLEIANAGDGPLTALVVPGAVPSSGLAPDSREVIA